MVNERIYVTGASGFVGRHVVDALVRRGASVVAFTRQASRIPPREGVEVRELDLLQLDAILPAIEDCTAGVHAAGAGGDKSERELFDLNVQASRHLAASCRRKPSLTRLVAFSSAAVLEHGDTAYRRAKIGMEAAVLSYDIDWTLLRPTLVLGRPDESAEMRDLVQRVRGRVVLPNGGRARIQPVHVADVAEAAATAVLEGRGTREKLTLAGPEDGISYRAFLEGIAARTGATPSFLSLPIGLLRLLAIGAAVVGRDARARAVIAFHSRDHEADLEDARRALGFEPRPYEAALDEAFGARASR